MTGGPIESSPTIADGVAYVGTNNHRVLALDAIRGVEQWTYETDSSVCGAPAVADGTVFGCSWYGTLFALNAATGEERWTRDLGTVTPAAPTVANGRVVIGHAGGQLHAINVDDGTEDWSIDIGKSIISSVATYDRTLYVSTGNMELDATPVNGPGAVVAVDMDDGSELWRTGTSDGQVDPRPWSAPIVLGHTVYVGSGNDVTYALDATDGTVQWRVEELPVFPWSAPAAAGGFLYVNNQYSGTVAIR